MGKKTLHSLVKVCSEFREIFEPLRYIDYTIDLNVTLSSELGDQLIPQAFTYIRKFEVHTSRGIKSPYKVGVNANYAGYVTKCIKQMSNLRSFRYISNPSFRDLI
jgi:hypothetical protein